MWHPEEIPWKREAENTSYPGPITTDSLSLTFAATKLIIIAVSY
jgi:hypothetical protein